ncbi:MAG: diguanylate cyclase [Gammaproteobacteria bacterium]|nr:diguanylate cyclase [Gammaproteobacteria bacterium]
MQFATPAGLDYYNARAYPRQDVRHVTGRAAGSSIGTSVTSSVWWIARRVFSRAGLAAAAVSVAYFLTAILAILLTREHGGVALLWPANAIAAALAIRFRWLSLPVVLLGVLLLSALADVMTARDTLSTAFTLAAINVAEVSLMIGAYRYCWNQFPIPHITVNHAAHMTLFFGLLIPAVIALPGGYAVHELFGAPQARAIREWWLSDALGACLFGPPIILFNAAAVERLLARRFLLRNALSALMCIGTCYLAVRYVRFPYAVMAVPLLITAFRFGGFGTAVLGLLCALSVLLLWVAGIRPAGLEGYQAARSLQAFPVWPLLASLMPAIAVGIGSDERRKISRDLRLSERRFRESLDRSPIGMVIISLDGVWLKSNAALEAMLGYSDREFAALPGDSLVHPEDVAILREQRLKLQARECDSYDIERRFKHRNGSWVWVRAAVSLVFDEEGRPLHYIAQLESVERRRAAQRALAEEKERLKTTLRSIADAVITTDAEQRVTYLNAAAERLLGQTLRDISNRRFDEIAVLTQPDSSRPAPDLLAEATAWGRVARRERPCVLHRPDGSVVHVVDSVSPVFDSDGKVTGSVIVVRDASAEYIKEQELSRRATRDALTGLANPFEFKRRARRALERARALERPAAIIAIDLDGFKAVNDTAGHAAGDAVLRAVAGVLQALVRRSDTVARLGGDEFAIILENCSDERISSIAAQTLEAIHSLSVSWGGASHSVGASLGVVTAHDVAGDDGAWLAAADHACYEAKRAGRGRVVRPKKRLPLDV